METIKGKVKIYKKKKVRNGKVYTWETAVIQVPSREIEKIKKYANREIEIAIITEEHAYILSWDKFKKHYKKYKPEAYPRNKKQIIVMETSGARIIYINRIENVETATKIIKQLTMTTEKPVIFANNLNTLERVLEIGEKIWGKRREIKEKQNQLAKSIMFETKLRRMVEKLATIKRGPTLQF